MKSFAYVSQPRSGERMQPTAQAVGSSKMWTQPRRGGRKNLENTMNFHSSQVTKLRRDHTARFYFSKVRILLSQSSLSTIPV
jgi:hypothetical protein